MTLYQDIMLQLSYRYVPPLYQRLLTAMSESPKTIRELCAEADAHYQSVYKALMYFKQQQFISIQAWDIMSKGPHLPRYGLGFAKSAPRPPKLSPAERSARHRVKQKALRGLSMVDQIKGI